MDLRGSGPRPGVCADHTKCHHDGTADCSTVTMMSPGRNSTKVRARAVPTWGQALVPLLQVDADGPPLTGPWSRVMLPAVFKFGFGLGTLALIFSDTLVLLKVTRST